MPIGYNANQVNMPQPQPSQVQQFNPQILNQNVQPLFPQPSGNVYNINSTLEVANVPVGAGISVALCLPENVMYIKTMQNGNPLFYPYKILPFTNSEQKVQESCAAAPLMEDDDPLKALTAQIDACSTKINALEEQFKMLNKDKGGFDI